MGGRGGKNMIDHLLKQSKGKKIIEVLVNGMWIPVAGTCLFLLNKDDELLKIKEIGVRKL